MFEQIAHRPWHLPKGPWVMTQSWGKLLFEVYYQPTSPAEPTKIDSVDHWLMERYCFYTIHHDNLYRCEIHHHPWLVQQAKVNIVHNSIIDLHQIKFVESNPIFHYAYQLRIWAWPLSRCTN